MVIPGGIMAFRFGNMGPDFKVTAQTEDKEVKWGSVWQDLTIG